MIDRREQLAVVGRGHARGRLADLRQRLAAEVLGREVKRIGALGLERGSAVLDRRDRAADQHVGHDPAGLDQSIVGRVVERGRQLEHRAAHGAHDVFFLLHRQRGQLLEVEPGAQEAGPPRENRRERAGGDHLVERFFETRKLGCQHRVGLAVVERHDGHVTVVRHLPSSHVRLPVG